MVLGFLFLVAAFPLLALAQQTPSVVINEIAWMGTPVEGVDSRQEWRYEWVELHNTFIKESVGLDGWSIELVRHSMSNREGEELYFQIPLQGSIPGNGYFLIGASDKISGVDPVKQQELPYGVDVNYANLGGKLLNEGMRVALKDSLGNIVDEVDAREGWMAGDNESKRTMERTTGEDRNLVSAGNQVSTPQEWQTSERPGGTPGAQNSDGFVVKEINNSRICENCYAQGSLVEESLNIFSSSFPLALALALGSAAGALGLRRFLARPEQGRRERQS